MDCLCSWGFYGLVIYLVYKILDYLIRLPQLDRRLEKHVLITGCDTGFGHDIAKRLDLFGLNVLAGCYTELGETILKKQASYRLKTFRLDVSDPDSVQRAFDFARDNIPQDRGLWALINNAGIMGNLGPCDWLKLEDYEQVFNVNLYGLISMTQTFLPLVKKARGRIVNMSSVLGRHASSGAAPYVISKYGVEAYSDVLRREMRPYGVSVHLIEPGFHRTEITSGENMRNSLARSWDRLTPEKKQEYGQKFMDQSATVVIDHFVNTIVSDRTIDVVDAYESAVMSRLPRARYLVGKDAKFFWMPIQLMPEWLGDWLLDNVGLEIPIPAVCLKK